MNGKSKFSIVSIIVLLALIQTTGAQDDILFRKHLVNSGINGFFYGFAIDIIADANSGAAAGIPLVAAGASVLFPLMTNSTKTITPNSLVLSTHGKAIGWLHGFALSTLIGGENAWNNNNYKLTVGLGAISSISLGILGNSLGKKANWTEGQVALYRHYGWFMPASGILIMAAITDESRLWGASDLIFGAGVSDNVVTATGPGFVSRDLAYGNVTEDRVASSVGSYAATATQNGKTWGMQMVAFRSAQ